MGNTISLPVKFNDVVEPISMSNGLTSVFIEVLVISGSILANTDREKELIIWLAQRDQSVVGIGTVGFVQVRRILCCERFRTRQKA